jgi:hypothetical protein
MPTSHHKPWLVNLTWMAGLVLAIPMAYVLSWAAMMWLFSRGAVDELTVVRAGNTVYYPLHAYADSGGPGAGVRDDFTFWCLRERDRHDNPTVIETVP